MTRKAIRRVVAAMAALIALLFAWGMWNARADPIVRRLTIRAPVARTTIVLLSDIHVGGPDMPPDRLARIVGQVNALAPDIVLIAGDFVSDKLVETSRYPAADAIAPLAALRPRRGTFAVLGNHDHSGDAAAIRQALTRAGIRVLDNDAARAGPFAIGGIDDALTGHADAVATLAAMRRSGGVPILLSHSPDPFATLSSDIGLMVAGHTHCGQIRLPVVGALSYASEHGSRYGCGIVHERGQILVVGAGLGTSILPLRFGAPPDLWQITIGD